MKDMPSCSHSKPLSKVTPELNKARFAMVKQPWDKAELMTSMQTFSQGKAWRQKLAINNFLNLGS